MSDTKPQANFLLEYPDLPQRILEDLGQPITMIGRQNTSDETKFL